MNRLADAVPFLAMTCAVGAQSNEENEDTPQSNDRKGAKTSAPDTDRKIALARKLPYKKAGDISLSPFLPALLQF